MIQDFRRLGYARVSLFAVPSETRLSAPRAAR
jgi:hypothetical protein